MATPAQISRLRLMTNQPLNEEPYTDATLGELIDTANGALEPVAADIWRSKAASVAHLVDISEGGSSRKMSDLYKNFLAMAEQYAPGAGEDGAGLASAPRTRKIERV